MNCSVIYLNIVFSIDESDPDPIPATVRSLIMHVIMLHTMTINERMYILSIVRLQLPPFPLEKTELRVYVYSYGSRYTLPAKFHAGIFHPRHVSLT